MRLNLLFLILVLIHGSPFSCSVMAQTYIKPPALIEGFSEIATSGGTTTLTKDSQTNQFFTGTSTQTVVLPSALTIPLGRAFVIQNKSTGSLTVNTNGGGLLTNVEPNSQIRVTVTNVGSSAGIWNVSTSGGLTGILGVDKGGTGVDGTNAPNGSLLIGNGTDFDLTTLTGTTNQVNVTNGAGSITLSTPQDIATTSNPTFASPDFTGDLTLSNANFDSIKAGDSLTMVLSTGLRSGGILAINTDTTKFDIPAGVGYVVNYSTPGTPTVKRVAFGPFTAQTVTNLASADYTWIMIDSTGAIVQQTTVPTPAQRRTNVVLGRLNHSNRTSISFANTLPDFEFSAISQLGDLMDSLGPFNVSGNTISANGANLKINKSAGTIFQKNFNYSSNTNSPHVVTTAGLTPASFAYQNQTGAPGTLTSDLDPTTYDVGGVTTTVPASNNATVQRVYLFGSNNLRVQRGQAFYPNFANALQDYAQETFVESPAIAGFGIPIAYIVMTKSCTSLQNTTCSKIIPAGKFGGSVGGAGGSSTTTLQQAYDNSVQPQIVVNSTQNGVQVRDASTPIGSSLFAVQNNSGTTNYLGVDVNGVSASNFVGTGTTGAVRVHNMLTAQRNALSAANGMIIYNTSLNKFDAYSNGAWGDLISEYVTTKFLIDPGDTLAISTSNMFQSWTVYGNGNITLSSTPFGTTAPLPGAEITIIGRYDDNTVTIPVNDAAKGVIGYAITLGAGQTATYKYNATLDRYVIKSTSN